ncbi:MAG: class I SAM-dependent methyltransferase [Bacteroidetes bacterium]|nr:MAG: class I SAM-dependent methyltransferase [Bacteroidota bacterium]
MGRILFAFAHKVSQFCNVNTLSQDLSLLARLFDLTRIAQEKPDAHAVGQYYHWTNWFYRKFHSAEGAMHFPLYLPNGATNHFEGLAVQASFVAEHAQQARHIAEIGCGSGFNLRQLARLQPTATYQGIDATAKHVRQARRFAQKEGLTNLTFRQGTFDSLPTESESLDMVFAVESFCYSQDLRHDLAEVARVLRKGGKFIIFDVFLQPDFDKASPSLQLASQLTAIGFAVAQWDKLTDLQQSSQDAGLQLLACTDLHATLLPNLSRFQQDARRLFEYAVWLRPLVRRGILPAPLLKHAMTGLLAPHAMRPDVQGYYSVVLQKT